MERERKQLGSHLILDIWGASRLDDLAYIEEAMQKMVSAAGATLIKTSLHHFGEGSGVTGVAILSESHISIHTWPEHAFAALDMFMCGEHVDVRATIPVVQEYFAPTRIEDVFLERGNIGGQQE